MKRILAVTLVGLIATLLAACGGAAEPTVTPEPTIAPTLVTIDLPPTAVPLTEADATATAESVAAHNAQPAQSSTTGSTQVLTVGVNASFAPFLFKDDNGNLAGLDMDIITALGALADFEVAFVDTDFADLLEGIAAGKYDVGLAAITATPERAERMRFTEPYFTTEQMPVSFLSAGQGLAVPVSSTVSSAADLTETSRIGVKTATTGAEYAQENLDGVIVEYPESDALLDALAAGEIDAAVLDNPVIASYIATHADVVRLAGGRLVDEAYAIAVRPDGEEIVASLNQALDELKASGEYQTLVNKWLTP